MLANPDTVDCRRRLTFSAETLFSVFWARSSQEFAEQKVRRR